MMRRLRGWNAATLPRGHRELGETPHQRLLRIDSAAGKDIGSLPASPGHRPKTGPDNASQYC